MRSARARDQDETWLVQAAGHHDADDDPQANEGRIGLDFRDTQHGYTADEGRQ